MNSSTMISNPQTITAFVPVSGHTTAAFRLATNQCNAASRVWTTSVITTRTRNIAVIPTIHPNQKRWIMSMNRLEESGNAADSIPTSPSEVVQQTQQLEPKQQDLLSLMRWSLMPSTWPERFKVVFMCFISFVICNLDRINISIAILPMAKTYGWSQSTVGIVQSAFYAGYILTQIPGGYWANKYGGKLVLGAGVVAWSLMTFLTPLAANSPLPVLLIARVLLGIGEGVAMPAMNQMVASWVPKQERSRSLSAIYSGMYMGSVMGLLLCPQLIIAFGWPSVFYSFGSLGFVWWALWQFGIGSSPDNCPGISESEKNYIMKSIGSAPDKKVNTPTMGVNSEDKQTEEEYFDKTASFKTETKIPWKALLSHPAVWAINISHFCVTYGYFVLLTWLPTYFSTKLGFDLSTSSFFAIIPWLAMFVCANIGGNIADYLLRKKMSITKVRKLMQTIGFLGPALFLGLVATTSHANLAVLFMSCALGLSSFSQSGVYSNHADIGPQYSGVLLGISNTIAALPGIFGVALTGFILDATAYNWGIVFGIAIFFYLLGTVVFNLFATGERVF